MTSLWVIIGSDYTNLDPDETNDPDVCGVYASKKEAIEEILKLYIEDDIDVVHDNTEKEECNHRPTPDIVKDQRKRLREDEYNTYTHRGNLYTLVECKLGAKHKFEDNVLEIYQKSL